MNPLQGIDVIFPMPASSATPGLLVVDLTAGKYLGYDGGTPAWAALPSAGASGIAQATLQSALFPLVPNYPAPGYAVLQMTAPQAALLARGNTTLGFTYDLPTGTQLPGIVDLTPEVHQVTVNGVANFRY